MIAQKSSISEDKKERIKVPAHKVVIAVPGYHSQKPCLKGMSGVHFH
jgi:hypothetical protein